jgi:hypothetical protein
MVAKPLVIYFEGADKGTLAAEARRAAGKFFEKCFSSVRPRTTWCGGRGAAYACFCAAKERREDCVLVVDAEEVPDPKISSPWKQRRIINVDRWRKPPSATDRDLHFMAPTMEAWLVANPESLAEYFGKGFKKAKLPPAQDLETVSKDDINAKLRAATKGCSPKGAYDKGRDSFRLLEKAAPAEIRKRCPTWAVRFCDELRSRGMK